LALSGTFGELRSNHFHSGIDIKTQGVEGKKLKAIADGVVSRVAVSSGGFGRAIYIDHPNGYTSVFAHCKSFIPEVENWVREQQYLQESFEINLFPEKDQFVFEQGEVVAYSGNTGGSFGPHLHFEIRKTVGQIPVNPLLFGFPVKDFIRPKILRLMVYPFGIFSQLDGTNSPKEFKLAGWGPKYRLESGDTLQLSGEFYFGIETHDRLNDSRNKNGVYEIEVFIDSGEVFHHRMEAFNFSESRYINSLIDYAYYSNNRKRVQKTRIEPNNQLSTYVLAENGGVFRFVDDQLHKVEYIVSDAHGNESVLTFYVQSTAPTFLAALKNGNHVNGALVFSPEMDNSFEDKDIKLEIPKGALYDTLGFTYHVDTAGKGFLSGIHHIHKETTSLHKWGSLSIKPDLLESEIKEKALIVKLGGKDGPESVGGEWDGEYITARFRDFGSYAIAIDSLPPTIKPINVFPGKTITDQSTIKFVIKDELASIANYRATMNDQWILMEWDPKNDLLTYHIDDRTVAGENQLKLVVTDSRNNERVYEVDLIR